LSENEEFIPKKYATPSNENVAQNSFLYYRSKLDSAGRQAYNGDNKSILASGKEIIMNTPVNKKGFCQINIVVADIETAAEKWAELLGIEKPEIRINHLEGGDEYTYRGKPISCDLKVCDIEMEGFVIELHEPISGDNSFAEFLEKHGNGVHHIGFEVGDKRDTIIAQQSDAGYDTGRTMGIYPGSSWTIVDGEDTLGVNLNIKPIR